MKRSVCVWSLLAGIGLSSCSPSAPNVPTAPPPKLAGLFAVAVEREANDSLAVAPYLDVIDAAADRPEADSSLATAVAALDALVHRRDQLGAAYRSRDGLAQTVLSLREAWKRLDASASEQAPVIKGVIARALHQLALYSGEGRGANIWSARRGCLQEATVIGPVDWTPLSGLRSPSPVAFDAPLAESYAGVAPFESQVTPYVVRADTCQLPVNATSFQQGVRAIVVDVKSEEAQRVHFALTSSSAAVLEVGGTKVLERSFEAGGDTVTRYGSAMVPEGEVRVVLRVAQRHDSAVVELDVWGSDGRPLPSRAPRPGDVAGARAEAPVATSFAPANDEDATVGLAAAAMLGAGEARASARLLEPLVSGPDRAQRAPQLHLYYARAIDGADEMSEPKLIERKRAAVHEVIEAWPDSWEGKIGQAWLTERRRGYAEGAIAALEELGVRGDGSALPEFDVMVLAHIADSAAGVDLIDVAEDAYDAVAREVPGSALVANLDDQLHQRAGQDAVKAACEGSLDRSTAQCLSAYLAVGDDDAVMKEIERLRALRQAPHALREVELAQWIKQGNVDQALSVYDAMYPAQRSLLGAVGLAAGRGETDEVKSRLARDMRHALDAARAIPVLAHQLRLTEDPARALEARGAVLVEEDKKKAFLPGAGTAVLRRLEHYRIEDDGLLHYLVYDLRRVSGTADVDQGAQAQGPRIEGRGSARLLRRRIHKKDGRILHPDRASRASQGHADLSQLETGDYVELVLEGWSLPSDNGQLVIDTPDLLPERTSVRLAEIEIRRPKDVPFSTWSHALLGKPTERAEGGVLVSRWKVENQAARRIEDGVPHMERGVGVSLGTQTWPNIGRAIGEAIESLRERDPFVARFAQEALASKDSPAELTPREKVLRVVTHAGNKIKMASGGELSDVAAMYSGGSQHTNARRMIETGVGSRSWVIYRALSELGIDADIAVAETEPFSSDPSFPPHAGRFHHPLVVAHLPDGDAWIDADVEGPPLPPGRISPELRGRRAILVSGEILTVEGTSSEAVDEVDVRLKLDAEGNAKGTLTVLLHGRSAQALSETFELVVGSDRREILRGVVQTWLPWADVEDVSLSSAEGSWEVALRADISVFGFGRAEGRGGKTWVLPGSEPIHLVFPRSYVGTLGATYASRAARKNALSIQTALQYHMRRRIELPPGAEVSREPRPVAVKSDRVVGSRTTKVEGNVITEDFRLSLPTGTIPANAYQTFVENVHAIDDGFLAGIRVEVK